MNKKPFALLAAGALAATPLTIALAGPAQADTERRGGIDGGRYDFNVDRDNGGFEVSADLDDVTPGSSWKVVLRQDGKVFLKRTIRADAEGDLDVERFRPDTAGTDVFALTAKKIGSTEKVRASITQ